MQTRLLCALLAWLGHVGSSSASRHHHETRLAYRNEWTVKVDGGAAEVQQVANQLRLHSAGPLKGLENVYLLVKEDHPVSSATAADHVTNSLAAHPKIRWVEQQFSKHRSKRGGMADFNDPSWDKEWYISLRGSRLRRVAQPQNSMNILPVMQQGVTGRGIGVVIIDDGVEHNHTDIAHAYDPSLSYDVVDGDPDPTPRYDEGDINAHGTKCAGIVSMQPNNDFCGVGIATGARLGAVRLLDGVITDRTEGEAFSAVALSADVISVSWGPTDSGAIADMPGRLLQDAIETAVERGRGGRGVVLVWASGNGGGAADDNCACDGYASSPFTLSVGSVDQDGRMPWYGEICASTMAVTYSVGHPNNVITTSMHDSCTSQFSGTSASAPMAASMVAMMLEVNPELTWRDVQHIVVYTSQPEPVMAVNGDWTTNTAGLSYSTRVGFGLMDASALVNAARAWNSSLSANNSRRYCQANGKTSAAWYQLGPRAPVRVTFQATCDGVHLVRHLEHVEVLLSLNYSRRGALSMDLISPQGTNTTILRPRSNDYSAEGFDGFKLTSVATWAEDPRGEWTLVVRDDTGENNHGELQKLKLILWGTKDPIHQMTARSTQHRHEDAAATTVALSASAGPERAEPDGSTSERVGPTPAADRGVGGLVQPSAKPVEDVGRQPETAYTSRDDLERLVDIEEELDESTRRLPQTGEDHKSDGGLPAGLWKSLLWQRIRDRLQDAIPYVTRFGSDPVDDQTFLSSQPSEEDDFNFIAARN